VGGCAVYRGLGGRLWAGLFVRGVELMRGVVEG